MFNSNRDHVPLRKKKCFGTKGMNPGHLGISPPSFQDFVRLCIIIENVNILSLVLLRKFAYKQKHYKAFNILGPEVTIKN